MKKSGIEWIGEIPDNWEIRPIRECLFERNEKNNQLQETTILSLSAKNGVSLYDDDNHSGNKPKEDLSGYKIVREDDIVANSMNILSGSVGLSKYNGVVSPVYYIYHIRNLKDSIRYFSYIFQCSEFQKNLRRLGKGILIRETEDGRLNTIRTRIPSYQLSIEKIPYPNENTQRSIAKFLDKKIGEIDSLIENEYRQIEKLIEYKQSAITEFVTKGLDKNTSFKESGVEWIKKIPTSWQVLPLKTLFYTGKGLPITKDNLVEKGIKVISYGQIHAKYNNPVSIDERLYRFVLEDWLNTNNDCLVNKSDFIFADTSEDIEGSGDFVYINNDETIFAGYHCVVLKAKKKENYKYLAYLFMSQLWKNQIQCKVKGVKLFTISQSILQSTSVILPTIEEQIKIANKLDIISSAISKIINIKNSKIEQLEEYKKSLIYEYVTGKKEVIA